MDTKYKLQNNFFSYLTNDIDSTTTNITVDNAVSPFSNLLSINVGEVSTLTITDNQSSPTKIEIISFTGLSDNGDGTTTLSGVQRGQEGSTSYSFQAGSVVVQSLTANVIHNIQDSIGNLESDVESLSASDAYYTGDASLSTDHSYYGRIKNIIAGESVAFGDILYHSVSTDEWYLSTSTSSPSALPARMVSVDAAGPGESVTVLKEGIIRDDSWSWVEDDSIKLLFVGETAGGLDYGINITSGNYTQCVGIIRSATTIEWKPETSYVQKS